MTNVQLKAITDRLDKIIEQLASPDVKSLLAALASRGITYVPDLAAEGCGWESAAEPEPEYFETLPEAIDHQIKLAVNEPQRTERR